MAYDGYLAFGETEIANRSRTLDYARNMGLHQVTRQDYSDLLPIVLGHGGPYTLPETDDAPWYDPFEPASGDFAGFLPRSVSGIEDSTRASSTFEFNGDGGRVTGVRNTTKTVVVAGTLIGKNEAAVEYGFRWLKRALQVRSCTPPIPLGCGSWPLTYLATKPEAAPSLGTLELDGGDPGTIDWQVILDNEGGPLEIDGGGAEAPPGWDMLRRHLRGGVKTRGPVIDAKRDFFACDGVIWNVQFTITTQPFEYGASIPVLRALGDGTNPYVDGLSGANFISTYEGEWCTYPTYDPVFDPNCPALVKPPAPPRMPIGCMSEFIGTMYRRYAEIPSDVVPLWDQADPVVRVRNNEAEDIRDVRVCFYRGGGDDGMSQYCDDRLGEYRISYIPAGAELTINASEKEAYFVDASGYRRDAASLILGGSKIPPRWFGLSCGNDYRITLDCFLDDSFDMELDLDLIPRTD